MRFHVGSSLKKSYSIESSFDGKTITDAELEKCHSNYISCIKSGYKRKNHDGPQTRDLETNLWKLKTYLI